MSEKLQKPNRKLVNAISLFFLSFSLKNCETRNVKGNASWLLLWAPSLKQVVRFRCTIGKSDLSCWCPPLFNAPIDFDFFGESTTVAAELVAFAIPATPWLCFRLKFSASLTAFRHCGQTNCSRYSVLSLEMVFLKRPDSPVDCKEKEIRQMSFSQQRGRII